MIIISITNELGSSLTFQYYFQLKVKYSLENEKPTKLRALIAKGGGGYCRNTPPEVKNLAKYPL